MWGYVVVALLLALVYHYHSSYTKCRKSSDDLSKKLLELEKEILDTPRFATNRNANLNQPGIEPATQVGNESVDTRVVGGGNLNQLSGEPSYQRSNVSIDTRGGGGGNLNQLSGEPATQGGNEFVDTRGIGGNYAEDPKPDGGPARYQS